MVYLFYFFLQNRDAQSLLPLTIKQINDAFQSSDDKSNNLIIDGVDVNTVRSLNLVLWKLVMFCFVGFLLFWQFESRLLLSGGCATKLDGLLMLLLCLTMALEGLSVTNGEYCSIFLILSTFYLFCHFLCLFLFVNDELLFMRRLQEAADTNEVEGIVYVTAILHFPHRFYHFPFCI